MTTVDSKQGAEHDRRAPSRRVIEAGVGNACQDSEYLFDVTLSASIRLKALNEAEARSKISGLLDCAPVHFGELAGKPVIGEAYLVGRARLVEANGEGA